MKRVLKELLFRLRAGPRCALCWLFDRLSDHFQDRRFGISTRGKSKTKLPREFVQYQPVSYCDLREIFRDLTMAPDDVFLDIGCGMGRAVCFAGMYSYRAIIGIELDGRLCEIARRNIARIEPRLQCASVRVMQANALAIRIPPEASHLFLFNPLHGESLDELLDGITKSAAAHPRSLRVIFTGTLSAARFRDAAARQKGFGLISERTLNTGARALVYNVQN